MDDITWHHFSSVSLLHYVFDVFSVHVLLDTELVWSVIKLLFAEQSINIRTRYTINILIKQLLTTCINTTAK